MNRSLIEIPEGRSVRLKGLQGGEAVRRRLKELGLIDESVMKLVKNDRKGPLIVRVSGSNIVLGRELAAKIQAEEVDETKKNWRIVIVGQPNSGKTSLFNRLTGSAQKVGNWPGVTVEKKTGQMKIDGMRFQMTDVPGIYSMSCYSMEEKITRDCLIGDKPDVIVNIVDANNLERHLYLTVQLSLMGIPMVIALNMMDEVAERGLTIDTKRLSILCGTPVYPVVVRENKGLDGLLAGLSEIAREQSAKQKGPLLQPGDLLNALESIAEEVRKMPELAEFSRWHALKFLEKDQMVEETLRALDGGLYDRIGRKREQLAALLKKGTEEAVPEWIYGITRGIAREVIGEAKKKKSAREIVSNFLDMIVLDKLFGVPVFLLVMFGLFQATFVLGKMLADWMQQGLNALGSLASAIPSPAVSSLVENGIIGGVGNVLLLIPYIFILFLLMSFLEDSGYMSRAAFVMDRFMHKIGLHGKSFIPLVMGFGCNVPAIMAARTLERQEEKIKTALMVPFMSCSGRLPVYVLFSSIFFGALGSFVVFGLYVFGIAAGILTGFLLQKTVLTRSSEGLIMELPPYRLPGLSNSFLSTWIRLKEYIVKAGTVIFALSVVLWALCFFPAGVQYGGPDSVIGWIGRGLGVLLAPQGFDWKMTVALATGFIAKEVVISTLGVLYGGADLVKTLAASMTSWTALAYLVFILLYTPCVATVAVLRSETRSWKWTAFSIAYGLTLAWVLSFMISSIGKIFGA